MSSIPNSAMPHAGGSQTAASQRNQATGQDFGESGRNGTGLMERARDHKTGIAIGVAVGAIAAAAIPFMLSGRMRSGERGGTSGEQRSDLYVASGTAMDRSGRS